MDSVNARSRRSCPWCSDGDQGVFSNVQTGTSTVMLALVQQHRGHGQQWLLRIGFSTQPATVLDSVSASIWKQNWSAVSNLPRPAVVAVSGVWTGGRRVCGLFCSWNEDERRQRQQQQQQVPAVSSGQGNRERRTTDGLCCWAASIRQKRTGYPKGRKPCGLRLFHGHFTRIPHFHWRSPATTDR